MPPPDRWGDYTPLGTVIEGTRILCCKVPLKHALVRSLPEEERFTPEILINKVSEMGHILGLVIDLTFTKKYYSSAELTDKEVMYHKIFTKGHEVPSDRVYGRFAHTLDTYLEENNNNESVMGIHCTHGVNRTGYLVCRYLIEHHNMDPEDAINAFNKARGHDLERENYIHDLRNRKPGVKTEYDPSTFNENEEEEAPYIKRKFPKSRHEVENSYSKLLDLHKPERMGEGYRQRERDKMMRNKRSSREMSDQMQNWTDEFFTRGYSRGHHDGRYGGQSHGSWYEDQIGAGYGNQWNRGHSRFDGNYSHDYRSYGMQGEEDFTQDYSYDSFSSGSYVQNRGLDKSNNYNGGQDSGGFRQRYRDRYGQRSYGDNQSYDYGFDQSYGYDEGYSKDYRSPMRYADWSGDPSEQYSRSGWQKKGQRWTERGSQRPNRRGRARR